MPRPPFSGDTDSGSESSSAVSQPAYNENAKPPGCVRSPLPAVCHSLGRDCDVPALTTSAPSPHARRRQLFGGASAPHGASSSLSCRAAALIGENGVVDFSEVELAELLLDAEQGCAAAQYVVAQCYREGRGGTDTVDYAAARQWHERAASQGFALSLRRLGYYSLMGWGGSKDVIRAIQFWRAAAEAGEACSGFNLAVTFERGEDGAPHDPCSARCWYEWAALKGHTAAMNNLGLVLGRSDKSRAKYWFRAAAARGHPMAQYNLCLQHNSARTSRAGRKWMRSAADNGNKAARLDLGLPALEQDAAG